MNTLKSFLLWSINVMRIYAALVGLLWFGVLVSRADTHYVSLTGTNNSPYITWPDAATNIQWAVDAATALDTVLVSNGTYNLTNTITIAKAITLRSVNGRDYTQLQMDLTWGSNRCIYLTTTGAIDGFTIANGCQVGDNGGGIYMTAGTIRNCTVVSNRVTGNYGGGINCSGGYVYNCLVASNSAVGIGGGVCLVNAVMGSNCVISSNYAASHGGGVFMSGYSRITDCVVSNNTAGGAWGPGVAFNDGSYCYASNCVIDNNLGSGPAFRINDTSTGEYCVVRNNKMGNTQSGACNLFGRLRNSEIYNNNPSGANGDQGLFILGGGIAENCVISNNSGYSYGQGVRLRAGGTLRNCLVINNTSVPAGNGYAVYCDAPPGGATVDCCTIARNLRGMQFTTGMTNVVINTIVYSNMSYNIDQVAGSVTWFSNCNVNATVSGANNINTNPAWVDPANYNFRLTVGSKCVNAGINQSWMTGAVDLDGRHRIDVFSGLVDMGCYEYLPSGTIFSFH